MNVELLQKVKAHILEEPNRFVMTRWQVLESPGVNVHLAGDEGQRSRKMPPCGTMVCIAGWTVILGDPDGVLTGVNTAERAAQLLRLPEVPIGLFWLQYWTPRFRLLWKVTMTKQDFIALADMLRTARMNYYENGKQNGEGRNPFKDEHIQFLADFCETQNRNFKRQRWLDYIAGKCGKNGGKAAA